MQLLARVTADDAHRMPPAKTGKRLTAEQVGLLRAWVEQGAKWSVHWAYAAAKPKRAAVKAAANPRK